VSFGRNASSIEVFRRPVATVTVPDEPVITAFGVLALTFMMVMYAMEGKGPGFIAAFALGCALSSVYGFISGAWPFGVVEAIWCGVALRRFTLGT
jgi:hypothetical protein